MAVEADWMAPHRAFIDGLTELTDAERTTLHSMMDECYSRAAQEADEASGVVQGMRDLVGLSALTPAGLPCGWCWAPAGKPCQDSRGNPMGHFHAQRWGKLAPTVPHRTGRHAAG